MTGKHHLVISLALLSTLMAAGFAEKSASPIPNEPNSPAFQSPATPTPTLATTGRTATIKEIENSVQARTTSALGFLQATLNLLLGTGGQVRTGSTSKTRIDFSEGTIVRLGENTLLTVEEISPSRTDPITRFQMEFGKIWISLFGGKMEIKTPVGVATVLGSFAVIECVPIPIECRFDNIEGRLEVDTQSVQPSQRYTLSPGTGTKTFSSLPPTAAQADFCANNPQTCDALKSAVQQSSGKEPGELEHNEPPSVAPPQPKTLPPRPD